jgi:hypothetical protein
MLSIGWALGLSLLLASPPPPPEDPVSARQTATRFIQALTAADVVRARSMCLDGAGFKALSRHSPDPKAYDARLSETLTAYASEMRQGLVFKDALVADALLMPASDKHQGLVLAVVHAQFFLPDGKPLESPLVLTFVRQGSEWRFLLR